MCRCVFVKDEYIRSEVHRLQLVMDCGALHKIVRNVGHDNPNIQQPALRVAGNISSNENNDLIDRIIGLDVIKHLYKYVGFVEAICDVLLSSSVYLSRVAIDTQTHTQTHTVAKRIHN